MREYPLLLAPCTNGGLTIAMLQLRRMVPLRLRRSHPGGPPSRARRRVHMSAMRVFQVRSANQSRPFCELTSWLFV